VTSETERAEETERGVEEGTVSVTYNGVTKHIEFKPEELIKAILDRAIQKFQVTSQPHLLSLFRADGTVVPENISAHDAGLRRGTQLYLRPDQVKGGAC
jgi:hypothetical protein